MNKKFKYILIAIGTVFLSQASFAQDDDPKWNADGEIEDAQFVIVKNKKLELPRANRFYIPVSVKKNDLSPGGIQYKLKEFDFTPAVSLPKIRVQKVGKPPKIDIRLWEFSVSLYRFITCQ